jgi:hypothetical protein
MVRILSFWEITHLKGDNKFRSHRENGEWGTPELRGINLKLYKFHILIFYYYRI